MVPKADHAKKGDNMRITVYNTALDANKLTILVKESSQNLQGIECLNNPQNIVAMFNTVFHANILAEEYVWVMAMNTKGKLLGVFEISHGGISTSFVTPREIFVRLALCGAASFVLIHNHPSGCTAPSDEDSCVTSRVNDAGKLMCIPLLDHIIIGDDYYSFHENGKIVE